MQRVAHRFVKYHRRSFLQTTTIHDYDEVFKLFHKVLAINVNDRTDAIKTKYSLIPYLNSSLFDISELEDQTIKINALDNDGKLALYNNKLVYHLHLFEF